MKAIPTTPRPRRRCWPKSAALTGSRWNCSLWNTDPNPCIAQAIQQDLSQIGIDASILSIVEASVIDAGGEADQAPMIWSGALALIADLPDASNCHDPFWAVTGG